MEPLICEVEGCGHRGGKYHRVGEKWVCDHCFRTGKHFVFLAGRRDTASSLFPFVTNHFDGTPTTVQNIQHLRRLENQHGAQSHAFNMNQSNWD